MDAGVHELLVEKQCKTEPKKKSFLMFLILLWELQNNRNTNFELNIYEEKLLMTSAHPTHMRMHTNTKALEYLNSTRI